MKKITKRRYDLEGSIIYRERSDCSYWALDRRIPGGYDAVKLDCETLAPTGEKKTLTVFDLIGDYLV